MSNLEAFNSILLITMVVSLVLALVSGVIQNRAITSEPILALGIGILVGPHVLGWIHLEDLTQDRVTLIKEAARLTIAVAILTGMLQVGWVWTGRNIRDLLLLLLVGLPIMWGLGYAALIVTLPLTTVTALLIAAMITPTDPVLAQSIVTSKVAEESVPAGLRRLMTLESSANDGLAYVFVMIPLLVAERDTQHYGWEMARVVLYDVVGALAMGMAIGGVVGVLMRRFGERWGTESARVTVSIALAFIVLTSLDLLKMDGIFGVFGAGLGLTAALGHENQARHARFNHALSRLFHVPTLTLLGLILPFETWAQYGWPLLGAVVLVLVLRRLPMLLLLKPLTKNVHTWSEALFVGWFGPIGIAALFYSMIGLEQAGQTEAFAVVSAIITGSVLAHGATGTLGARALGRHLPAEEIHRTEEDEENPESGEEDSRDEAWADERDPQEDRAQQPRYRSGGYLTARDPGRERQPEPVLRESRTVR